MIFHQIVSDAANPLSCLELCRPPAGFLWGVHCTPVPRPPLRFIPSWVKGGEGGAYSIPSISHLILLPPRPTFRLRSDFPRKSNLPVSPSPRPQRRNLPLPLPTLHNVFHLIDM